MVSLIIEGNTAYFYFCVHIDEDLIIRVAGTLERSRSFSHIVTGETGSLDSKERSWFLRNFSFMFLNNPLRNIIDYSMRVAFRINEGLTSTCRDVSIVSCVKDSGANPTLDNVGRINGVVPTEIKVKRLTS